MPYLNAKTAGGFGFVPAQGPNGRTNVYSVSSSEASNIFAGDVVTLTSIGSVKLASSGGTATINTIVGVAAQTMFAAAGDKNARNFLVYDDPAQVYYVANSTAALDMNIAQTGKRTSFISTTIGSSTLQRSAAVLLAGSSGATLPLTIIGLHPIEEVGTTNSYSTSIQTKWLVQFNQHSLAQGQGQLGNTTT